MHHDNSGFLSQVVSPNNAMRRTQTNQHSGGLARGLSGSLVRIGHTSPEIPMRASADAANFLDNTLKKSNESGNVSINEDKGVTTDNRNNSAIMTSLPDIQISENTAMLKSLD